LLTLELAAALPPISRRTQERLGDWHGYLGWKRNLVREKSTGLRYIAARVADKSAFFRAVASDDVTLERLARGLRQQPVVALDPRASTDAWTLRLDECSKRAPRSYELGEAKELRRSRSLDGDLEACPWTTPVIAELEVELSEQHRDALLAADDPAAAPRALADDLPKAGSSRPPGTSKWN
jgi:hypothetical protein